jgi:acyl carrier protein
LIVLSQLAPLAIATRNFGLHNAVMNEIYARLEEIFRAVLMDDSVTLTPETSGKDLEAWDSLTHVTVMVHVERAFDIQFTSSEISGWQNVGELAQLIESRLRQKG